MTAQPRKGLGKLQCHRRPPYHQQMLRNDGKRQGGGGSQIRRIGQPWNGWDRRSRTHPNKGPIKFDPPHFALRGGDGERIGRHELRCSLDQGNGRVVT
jgi:hypothetical protein